MIDFVRKYNELFNKQGKFLGVLSYRFPRALHVAVRRSVAGDIIIDLSLVKKAPTFLTVLGCIVNGVTMLIAAVVFALLS